MKLSRPVDIHEAFEWAEQAVQQPEVQHNGMILVSAMIGNHREHRIFDDMGDAKAYRETLVERLADEIVEESGEATEESAESDTRSPNIPPIDELMAWENGELDEDDTIDLFQNLVDSGLAWKLQGMYGRQAKALLDAGLIRLPAKRNPRDPYWINRALSHGYRGELHDELGIPENHRIPKRLLDKLSRKGGKIGHQARLAKTLESLNHRKGR